jgi:hypothetical protein
MNAAARRAATRRQRQWRVRQRAHRAVWEVEGGECELTMLIRSQWLPEADAADARKVGKAISALLASMAKNFMV